MGGWLGLLAAAEQLHLHALLLSAGEGRRGGMGPLTFWLA